MGRNRSQRGVRFTRADIRRKVSGGTLPKDNLLFDLEEVSPSLLDNLKPTLSYPKPSEEFQNIIIVLRGHPMAKQSVRAYAQRYMNGPRKGDVITHRNNNGRLDVTLGFHKDPLREKRERDYIRQIKEQLRERYPNFIIFQKEVHVLKFHVIFPILESMPKYLVKRIADGEIVWHTTAPDLPDNLKKLPNDAMSGIIYTDDKLIVSETNVAKYYGLDPGYIIELSGK